SLARVKVLCLSREVSVPARSEQRQPARVRLLEVGDNRVVRHIGVVTSLPDVLHVSATSLIVFMEERVAPRIEFQREHTETFAEAQVEGGCGFHPPAFKIKLS